MTEEDKNRYFENLETVPRVSFPMPDRIIRQFYLLSVMKDTEQECTCFLSSRENGRFYILKRCIPSAHDSALQEYEILKKLHGKETPKIIYLPSYMDFFQEDGASYLLREYLYGYSFREYVASSATDSLPDRPLVQCALAICEALEYLHSQQPPIIHRDIKPDNVILDQYGQFRLIDFGIARYYKKNQQGDTENMGSEQSAAPEQFGYTQTDARTDIYSLGALLLYGATCEFELEKLKYASISKDLKRIIQKCMQFAPKDRYQNVHELKRDLNRIQLHSDSRQKRSWFFTGAVCGAGLLAAFSLGIFLCTSQKPLSGTHTAVNARSAPESGNDAAPVSGTDFLNDPETGSDTTLIQNPGNERNTTSLPETRELPDTEAITATPDPKSDPPSPPDSESDSNEDSVHSTDSDSLVPDDEAVYTFREPLIEQAVRKCLQKEETDPITYRDLRGILFIGIYGHQILDYFDQVWPNVSLPYIETEEYLNAGLYKITGELNTLEDFAYMPNLRSLALYNVTLSNLTGLEKLHLEALALGNTAVSSLELIPTQTELKKLVLCSNPELTDLNHLTLLPNLSSLSITDMEPESYDFLWQIPNLEKLTASNPTEELTAALRKSQVKDLKLWNFPYPGELPLTSLSGCTSLERIELNGYAALDPDRTDACTYLDHETPQDLPNLKELCLFGYGYRDFGTLAGLESLETLHLFDGTTSVMLDCRNLDQLPSLTSIYANREMIDMIAETYPERKFELYPF